MLCKICSRELIKPYAIYQLATEMILVLPPAERFYKMWVTNICDKCEEEIYQQNRKLERLYPNVKFVEVKQ